MCCSGGCMSALLPLKLTFSSLTCTSCSGCLRASCTLPEDKPSHSIMVLPCNDLIVSFGTPVTNKYGMLPFGSRWSFVSFGLRLLRFAVFVGSRLLCCGLPCVERCVTSTKLEDGKVQNCLTRVCLFCLTSHNDHLCVQCYAT